jgi:hypothetical protein
MPIMQLQISKMNNKTICNRMQSQWTMSRSLYDTIELNESEPIIFQRDQKKQEQQYLKP